MDHQTTVRIAVGVALLAAAAFLLLSLLGYNSQDPPWADHPANNPVKNPCGVVGAHVAAMLRLPFGPLAAYLLVLLLGGYGVSIVRCGKPAHLRFKLVALGVFFPSVGVVSHLLFGNLKMGAPGPAGLLGRIAGQWLEPRFGVGAYIIFICAAALSFLVLTDMIPYRLAQQLWERWRERRREREVEGLEAAAPEAGPRLRRSQRARKEADAEEESPPPAEETPEPRQQDIAPPPRKKREKPAEPTALSPAAAGDYRLPGLDLLDAVKEAPSLGDNEEQIRQKAQVLERTLEDFGIEAEVVEIDRGPVITQYEIELAPGIKITKVQGLSDDIARQLRAPGVRVIAPIPGKTTIGIEVPNASREIVRLRALFESGVLERKRMAIPLLLGKDAVGEPLVADLTTMPHLLIAGATGAGKSVCINSIIISVLMTQYPDNVKLVLVDPKMVELAGYEGIAHLLCPVLTDMKKAASVLEWACVQMDERYEMLSRAGVRNITTYNNLSEAEIRRRLNAEPDAQLDDIRMPYIVVIMDEFADLMMTATKEVESSIIRLSQKSRAVGIHIVMATQRPSVDVITGLIKANLPCRMAFHTAQKVDSRTILDRIGADKLLGQGDMLFLPPGTSKLIRAQGTYVSDEEILRIVEHVRGQSQPRYHGDLLQRPVAGGPGAEGAPETRDELYNEAVRAVVQSQRGSVSLLQRKLGIGYGRAARLIDIMAENGILGPYKGSQAREVFLQPGEWPGTGEGGADSEDDSDAL